MQTGAHAPGTIDMTAENTTTQQVTHGEDTILDDSRRNTKDGNDWQAQNIT